MSENLKDLIAKMKQENSQTTSVNTNPKAQKVKAPEEEIDEEFDESVDLEEQEETPKPVKKPVKKDVPQETEEVSLAEQIRNLHDEGIFRLELLGVLHQMNNNLRVIAGVLVDYKK